MRGVIMLKNMYEKYKSIWNVTAAMFVAFIFLAVLPGCQKDEDPVQTTTEDLVAKYNLQTLGSIPYPADNPPIPERIALGRLLFYDPILGGEQDVACGTCHHPQFGFSDFRQLPSGTGGFGLGPSRTLGVCASSGLDVILTPRNAPSCWNLAFNTDDSGNPSSNGVMFWDGRISSLEIQASRPITSRVEMRGDAYGMDDVEAGNISVTKVVEKLREIPEYVQLFTVAFPLEASQHTNNPKMVIDSSTYVRSIGSFERELVGRYTPYDNFVRGDASALNEIQKQGLELFFGKAKCSTCHSGPMFTDFEFVVNGVPQFGPGKGVIPGDDTGREEKTLDPADRYKFRTPTLRNVELTAPYMHDGIFGTLEEVVQFYNNGAQPRHSSISDDMLDPVLTTPLGLTDDEVQAVVEFMRALTDPGVALPSFYLTVPEVVPSGLTPLFGVNDWNIIGQPVVTNNK